MRTFRFLGLAVALTAAASVATGDDLKSGPDKRIGGPFDVKAVTGDNKGKTFCYV